MLKRNTQILLGVFALLVVVLLVLRKLPKDETPDTAEDLPTQVVMPTLFDFEAADISGVRIENVDGGAVQFTRDGETWTVIQPPAEADEVDATRIESLVSQLSFLRLVTETALDAPLSALGLDIPDYALDIFLASGMEHEIQIGDASIAGTGYYVSVDGAAPQLVTKSILDTFINLFDNPPLLPTPIPTVGDTGTITDTATLEPEG